MVEPAHHRLSIAAQCDIARISCLPCHPAGTGEVFLLDVFIALATLAFAIIAVRELDQRRERDMRKANNSVAGIDSKDESPTATADRFKQALRRVASTVTVITAHDGARHHGMTATAVMSVSIEPPALVICINQRTLLHDILISAERFCVNVLDEAHIPISAAFSGAKTPEQRFAEGAWTYEPDGLGILADAQASIICKKTITVPHGTHSLFIGEVQNVRFKERPAPLIYLNAAYCRPHPSLAA